MKIVTINLFRRFLVIPITLISLYLVVSGQQNYEFPFLNPGNTLSARVDDLVGRMTIDEKIGQMMNSALSFRSGTDLESSNV